MSAAFVSIGIASIFLAAFVSHFLTRRRREAERQEPPIPEFTPAEPRLAKRLTASQIKWEISSND